MNKTPKLISFSGGRTSAYMTWLLIQESLSKHDHIVFADTGKEREETYEFIDNCEKHWNIKIHKICREGKFEKLLEKRKYSPNIMTRFCTSELKVIPIKKFMKKHGYSDYEMTVGIRYDEPKRAAKILAQNETGKNNYEYVLPLYKNKITIQHVNEFWKKQPFNLNLKSYEGNCDLCFLKGKQKLIQIIRENPKLVEWWINCETTKNATFKNPKQGGMSYSQMKEIAINQGYFNFNFDETFECFCNID